MLPGPTIVHVRTHKGRGYRPAEADQIGFHGAALPPMTVVPDIDGYGPGHKMPTESMTDDAAPPAVAVQAPTKAPNYTAVFAAELIEAARSDRRIVGITAGMPTGTGMAKFQAAFPDRMFDVGIAEQHSMTFATGLAMGGLRPVVALYSTFLQRAFDQTVHDVCQNDQPVIIAVDRAGLVGEDGTSHQGMFSLPAQRQLPNLVIASPKDEQELRSLVRTALAQDHPFALHYPRDAGFGLPPVPPQVLPIGRGEVLREGRDVLFVGFGPIVGRVLEAADALEAEGWSVGVINARFAKPLDGQLILDEARGKQVVVTFEESVVTGGFGSGVLEAIEEARLTDRFVSRRRRSDRRHPRRPVRGPRLRHRPPARVAPRRPRSRRAGPRDTGCVAGDARPLRGCGRLGVGSRGPAPSPRAVDRQTTEPRLARPRNRATGPPTRIVVDLRDQQNRGSRAPKPADRATDPDVVDL